MGRTMEIRVPAWDECQSCHGTGCKPGTSRKTCPTCQGHGAVRVSNGLFQVHQTCPKCHGSGQIISDPCPNCQGVGKIRTTKVVEVKIPAGINDGQRIRMSGRGEPGMNGGESGDLYLGQAARHLLARRRRPSHRASRLLRDGGARRRTHGSDP